MTIVGKVKAICDRMNLLAFVRNGQRVGDIDQIVTVAPAVEWIAIARYWAYHAFCFDALVGREWWKMNARCASAVQDHLGKPPGPSNNRDAASARPSLALAYGKHFCHLIQTANLDCAMCS